ncbi:disease resistance protein UNI-like [Eucalyptus grandis]|uniref:disease resistance protein UNI-like n=1 Tax=Eucalyptus grandis TaxID=71139 RepID=UPI00192E898F|nr:disease resistance protein UNI-like [Eucalyptus grandis]
MASTSSASWSYKLRNDGVFESRDSIVWEILDALADGSNSVVGVHGMGGVGKSTLLVDAERRIREREVLLPKRLEDEESKKKKALIILDNLWKGLDLKSVGISCGHDNEVIGCKLLLTSRDQDSLRSEMGCYKDFPLDGLQEEEAKRLSERLVEDKVHNDQKPFVDEALHKCSGLPFLIVTLARLFKDDGLFEWKDALKQFEMSKNNGISEVMNIILQLSYDHLIEEEGKSLLQLCVVYGASEPSLENLVKYGVGLGLFGEASSMEEARYRLSSLIHTLQASSLLLENGKDDGFKIHDLVREFVATVASRDNPFLMLKDKNKSVIELLKDKLKRCRAIWFPYVGMKEFRKELDCPELCIFLLFTNNESFKVPDSYFNSMQKLMILNLTRIHLTHLFSSFQFLKSLYTL